MIYQELVNWFTDNRVLHISDFESRQVP